MESIESMNIINIAVMVLVGAVAGSLAGFIIRNNNYGFIVNAIIGIFGAVVGGAIFNFLKITPGAATTKMIANTFNVDLPQNIVGMIVSATIGAILILLALRLLGGRKR